MPKQVTTGAAAIILAAASAVCLLAAQPSVVQLYVQDVVSSVTRPLQELKGFQRVTLAPGATRRVTFTLAASERGLFDGDMKWVVEPGEFRVRVSNSSVGGLTGTFEVR